MATAPMPPSLVPSFTTRLWSDEVGMVAGPDEGEFRGYQFSSGRSLVAPMATAPAPLPEDTEPSLT